MTKHGLMLAAGSAALIATSSAAHSANESLESSVATRPGWEIGAQLSDYRYEEPGLRKEMGSGLAFCLLCAGNQPADAGD
jgi:hypothetical protein